MLLSSLGAVCTYLLFLVLYPLAPSSHVPPGSVPLFFSVLRRPPLPPPPPSPTTRDQVFHFRPSFLFLARLRLLTSRTRTTAFQRKKIKVSLPSPLLFFSSLQKRPQKVLSFRGRAPLPPFPPPPSLSAAKLRRRRSEKGPRTKVRMGKRKEREREKREGSRGRKGGHKGRKRRDREKEEGETPLFLLPPSRPIPALTRGRV